MDKKIEKYSFKIIIIIESNTFVNLNNSKIIK
jgi:hypothetical protein